VKASRKPDAKPDAKAGTEADAKKDANTDAKADTNAAPVWVPPAMLAAAMRTGLPEGAGSMGADLTAAARLFDNRRDPRVLLLVIAVAPPAAPEAAAPAGPEAPAGPTAPPPGPKTPPAGAKGPLPVSAEQKPAPTAPAEDEPLAAGLEEALRAKATVYVVAVGPGEARVPPVLRETAARSGGQVLLAPDLAAVPQALHALSEALRNRYLLTFMPGEQWRAGWHALDLAVRQPDLAVQAPKTLAFP
jgi:hypothetical protein